MGLLLGTLGATAQYNPATITESHLPNVPGEADRSDNTNCHSYGNVPFSGNTYDLSVHSWDPGHYGPSFNLDNFGIAWKSQQGSTVNEGYYTGAAIKGMTGNYMQSSDIAIMYDGTNNQPWVIVAYYNHVDQSFYLDKYKWDPAGNTMGYISSTQLAGSSTGQLGWIHLDAIDMKTFVVTWQNNGYINAWAGDMSNTTFEPELSPNGAALLDLGLGWEVVKPDVALGNVNGNIVVHFVCTNIQGDAVIESRMKFADLYNNSSSPLFPSVEDVYTGHTFQEFNLPRIDCPDHSNEDAWTWVISGLRSGGLNQDVISHVLYSGNINHYVLNNGSLTDGVFPVIDVSDDLFLEGAEDPVVAYDNSFSTTPDHVYYAWLQHDDVFMPTYSHKLAYVGFRQDVTTGFLDNERYWIMSSSLSDGPVLNGSIALSGQNDASPELYSTYTMLESTGYFIARKGIPWNTNNSFRQAPPAGTTTIAVSNSGSDFTFYPNPAGAELHIRHTGDAARKVVLQAADVTGRIVFHYAGTAASLEHDINVSWFAQAVKGMYIIRIGSEDGYHQELKLLKQ